MISLEEYFDRTGIRPELITAEQNDLDRLRTLILAHTQSISFENLNSLMRIPVPLDLESIENKMVRSARGGYCFEQNAYFAAVLERLEYSVQRLAARVIWGGSIEQAARIPRAHMILLVHLSDGTYLCDVGFGGLTPTGPLFFEIDREQQTPHETYRIVRHESLYLLQASIGPEWKDVYLFDLQPQSEIDYEVANHFVATHPGSHFRSTLMAARAFPGGRYNLRNRTLTTFRPGGEKELQELSSPTDIIEVLHANFGIDVPDATKFAASLDYIKED